MKRAILTTRMSAVLAAGLTVGAVNLATAEKSDTKKLIKALTSDNIGWRVSAAQILGDNQEERAVKPLIRMLNNDFSYAARLSAAVALAKIGDKKALRALKKVSKHDRNQTVRTVALGAHEMLENSSAQLASEK